MASLRDYLSAGAEYNKLLTQQMGAERADTATPYIAPAEEPVAYPSLIDEDAVLKQEAAASTLPGKGWESANYGAIGAGADVLATTAERLTSKENPIVQGLRTFQKQQAHKASLFNVDTSVSSFTEAAAQGKLTDWLAFNSGSGAASIAQMAGGGLATKALAGRAMPGAAAASFLPQTGGNLAAMREAGVDATDNLGTAAAAGLAQTALDYVPLAAGAKWLAKPFTQVGRTTLGVSANPVTNVVARGAQAGGAAIGVEGLTGGAQNALEQGAVQYAETGEIDPSRFDVKELVDSAAAEAAGGVGIAGAGGAARGAAESVIDASNSTLDFAKQGAKTLDEKLRSSTTYDLLRASAIDTFGAMKERFAAFREDPSMDAASAAAIDFAERAGATARAAGAAAKYDTEAIKPFLTNFAYDILDTSGKRAKKVIGLIGDEQIDPEVRLAGLEFILDTMATHAKDEKLRTHYAGELAAFREKLAAGDDLTKMLAHAGKQMDVFTRSVKGDAAGKLREAIQILVAEKAKSTPKQSLNTTVLPTTTRYTDEGMTDREAIDADLAVRRDLRTGGKDDVDNDPAIGQTLPLVPRERDDIEYGQAPVTAQRLVEEESWSNPDLHESLPNFQTELANSINQVFEFRGPEGDAKRNELADLGLAAPQLTGIVTSALSSLPELEQQLRRVAAKTPAKYGTIRRAEAVRKANKNRPPNTQAYTVDSFPWTEGDDDYVPYGDAFNDKQREQLQTAIEVATHQAFNKSMPKWMSASLVAQVENSANSRQMAINDYVDNLYNTYADPTATAAAADQESAYVRMPNQRSVLDPQSEARVRQLISKLDPEIQNRVLDALRVHHAKRTTEDRSKKSTPLGEVVSENAAGQHLGYDLDDDERVDTEAGNTSSEAADIVSDGGVDFDLRNTVPSALIGAKLPQIARAVTTTSATVGKAGSKAAQARYNDLASLATVSGYQLVNRVIPPSTKAYDRRKSMFTKLLTIAQKAGEQAISAATSGLPAEAVRSINEAMKTPRFDAAKFSSFVGDWSLLAALEDDAGFADWDQGKDVIKFLRKHPSFVRVVVANSVITKALNGNDSGDLAEAAKWTRVPVYGNQGAKGEVVTGMNEADLLVMQERYPSLGQFIPAIVSRLMHGKDIATASHSQKVAILTELLGIGKDHLPEVDGDDLTNRNIAVADLVEINGGALGTVRSLFDVAGSGASSKFLFLNSNGYRLNDLVDEVKRTPEALDIISELTWENPAHFVQQVSNAVRGVFGGNANKVTIAQAVYRGYQMVAKDKRPPVDEVISGYRENVGEMGDMHGWTTRALRIALGGDAKGVEDSIVELSKVIQSGNRLNRDFNTGMEAYASSMAAQFRRALERRKPVKSPRKELDAAQAKRDELVKQRDAAEAGDKPDYERSQRISEEIRALDKVIKPLKTLADPAAAAANPEDKFSRIAKRGVDAEKEADKKLAGLKNKYVVGTSNFDDDAKNAIDELSAEMLADPSGLEESDLLAHAMLYEYMAEYYRGLDSEPATPEGDISAKEYGYNVNNIFDTAAWFEENETARNSRPKTVARTGSRPRNAKVSADGLEFLSAFGDPDTTDISHGAYDLADRPFELRRMLMDPLRNTVGDLKLVRQAMAAMVAKAEKVGAALPKSLVTVFKDQRPQVMQDIAKLEPEQRIAVRALVQLGAEKLNQEMRGIIHDLANDVSFLHGSILMLPYGQQLLAVRDAYAAEKSAEMMAKLVGKKTYARDRSPGALETKPVPLKDVAPLTRETGTSELYEQAQRDAYAALSAMAKAEVAPTPKDSGVQKLLDSEVADAKRQAAIRQNQGITHDPKKAPAAPIGTSEVKQSDAMLMTPELRESAIAGLKKRLVNANGERVREIEAQIDALQATPVHAEVTAARLRAAEKIKAGSDKTTVAAALKAELKRIVGDPEQHNPRVGVHRAGQIGEGKPSLAQLAQKNRSVVTAKRKQSLNTGEATEAEVNEIKTTDDALKYASTFVDKLLGEWNRGVEITSDPTKAGEIVTDTQVIQFSTAAASLDGVLTHEAAHRMVTGIRNRADAGNATAKRIIGTLDRASSTVWLQSQIAKHFEGHPNAEKISAAMRRDVDERIAYAIELAAQGKITLGDNSAGVVNKVLKFLRWAFRLTSENMRFENFAKSFISGDMAKTGWSMDSVDKQFGYRQLDSIVERATKALAPVAEALRQVFRSAEVSALALADKYNVPELRQLVKMYADKTTGLTYVRIRENRRLRADYDLYKEKFGTDAVTAALKGLLDGQPANDDATKELRKVMTTIKDFHGDWDDLPPVYDYAAINKDSAAWNADVLEFGRRDANLTLDQIVDNKAVMPGLKSSKMFTKPALEQKWRQYDPDLYFGALIDRAVQHRVMPKEVVEKAEALVAAIKKQGNARVGAAAKTFFDAQHGRIGSDMDPKVRKLMANISVATNLATLPLALFASLVEPFAIAARSGNFGDIIPAYIAGMSAFPKTIGSLGGPVQLSEDELYAVHAGILEHTVNMESMGDLFIGENASGLARKASKVFFKWNMLDGWSRQMRVAASVAGRGFVERHAKDATWKTGDESTRYLEELGLTKDDVDGKIDWGSKKIMNAVAAFADSAAVRPNEVNTAPWMHDPHWMLFAHMKRFTMAFQDVILSRAFTEYMEHSNATPLMILLASTPFAYGSGVLKHTLTGSDYIDKMTTGEAMVYSIKKASLLGTSEWGLGAVNDPAFALSPALNLATDSIAKLKAA
jgi:hypothetical protein